MEPSHLKTAQELIRAAQLIVEKHHYEMLAYLLDLALGEVADIGSKLHHDASRQ